MAEKRQRQKWFRLDNAAKIFPASMRPSWSNVFRLSVTFREKVSPAALQRAVEKLAPRFPSVYVRLGKGLFWYYLEESKSFPKVREEGCQPLLPMKKREMRRCAVRILYYENRIAVEFFHALTDGSGGLVFLKSLAAAYLEEVYGEEIPKKDGVLSPKEQPRREELEDAFLRYARGIPSKRETESAFCLKGEEEPDGFLHVTTATVSLKEALSLAKEKGVSLTALLSASLCVCIQRIQKRKVAPHKEKAVRIQVPVNLRKHFPSETLRNFVAVMNLGMEKGEGDASFEEVLSRIHHQMALMNTPRNLRAVFTANVNSEKGIGIRLVPLFLKNIVMRAVFDRVGESLACLCLSNLGSVKVPQEMEKEITRFDFIIGPQAKAPYNCGVISFENELRITLVRNTLEPELEREFFPFLSSLGLDLTLESNER